MENRQQNRERNKQKKRPQNRKSKTKKKNKWIKPLIITLGTVALGAGVGYWFYVQLDYQDQADPASYEGYEFYQLDFLSRKTPIVKATAQDENNGSDVTVNSEYTNVAVSNDRWDSGFQELLTTPSSRPYFHLINVFGKQTTYKAIANLSSINQIERVQFSAWGVKDGEGDIKYYEGAYDSATNTWQAEIPVKEHQESGQYQTDLLVTKKSGKTEEVALGSFNVSEPTIEASIDGSRVNMGQFEVNIVVNSKSDVEAISIPIWSREDQSDLKWYEGVRQSENNYKVHVDYEDFDYSNGLYTASAYFTGVNGLTAHSAAGTAEINMSHPVRIRVLNSTALFQDRQLTQKVKDISANSMAYVQAIVFNADQKVYRTTDGYVSSENIDVSEMTDDLRYVAHRGNHQEAPENSLPAFQKANAWGIETDIWLTKDGKWVVMHDGTVDRMTDGTGKISDMTLAEIRKMHIDTGANKDSYAKSELVVPTLEEYLGIMVNKQSVPFIEIKATNLAGSAYDSLISLIGQYGLSETAVVISFDYQNLVEVKKRAPQMQVQILGDVLDDDIINKASSLGANAGLDIRYDGAVSNVDMIVKAQSKGLAVHLWGVPQSEFKRMEALGIDNLTTDYD
ncbi:GBS Bsp-like repeat-containing protein [Enterococcus sp. BWM-S5]|uniref:GBS Bsp-like repeat-containing protein n=1 Tax=Enterococcus larvae TaxID=2794352 RepID=A0ABS4CID8_9ENTE|nr:glycerophosphodiester phosphodiesterase family protein [Enterococcus larvae]MBP1046326.1 GBS Bsp-like repeat-containing protein [Enterococcus larvae]